VPAPAPKPAPPPPVEAPAAAPEPPPSADTAAAAPVLSPGAIDLAGAQEEEPLYAQTWFWPVVIGAVALAAGGTVLALSTGGDRVVVPPFGSAGTIDWR
jgi:hypothetical protein